MILILMGAPGAGKGTQADMLVKSLGLRKISTGDALRRQIEQGTAVGKSAALYMNEGRLVPDDVLFEVLKEELGTKAGEGVLLDGYPRNLNQAKTLESITKTHPIKGVVHLKVENDELIRRLSGRRTCVKCGASFHVDFKPSKAGKLCESCGAELQSRPDDAPEKIRVRLGIYEKETSPVLEFYREKGLYQGLDGSDSTEKVFSRLKQIVENLIGALPRCQ